MTFNTAYSDLKCPYCEQEVVSGVGFRLGVIDQSEYRIGEKLKWDGDLCRPVIYRDGRIKSIGYFNCDNIKCSTWQDCYPEVQQAVVTVENGILTDISVFHERTAGKNFDIIEPEGLS